MKSAESQYAGSLTDEERSFLYDKFKEWGFLDSTPAETNGDSQKKWRLNWKIDDITAIKFLSVNPDSWLTSMMPVIRALLHPVAIIFYSLLILSAGMLLVRDETIINGDISFDQFGFGSYVIIYITILLTTVIHACIYLGDVSSRWE